METIEKKVKYPENLHLKEMITGSGRTISGVAKLIKHPRQKVSDTVHGHMKGINIVPKILALINQKQA